MLNFSTISATPLCGPAAFGAASPSAASLWRHRRAGAVDPGRRGRRSGRVRGADRPWDVREQVRAVGVPVHVLVPTDVPVPTGSVVDELSTVTHLRWTFETVADTTHSVHRDRPALVVDRAVRPPDRR